ncbi:hypothetical protein C5167_040271 [Papaver somniferum]|uniref:ATP-dependent helicase HRQ1 winged helix domain-containing protein n=1 Tax=Papaver somniferum TaxID=3469 RepID=A0A4Y7IEN7_PAPSO|nr:hypothetical protein C5167_040271 [Papaver somniferum]
MQVVVLLLGGIAGICNGYSRIIKHGGKWDGMEMIQLKISGHIDAALHLGFPGSVSTYSLIFAILFLLKLNYGQLMIKLFVLGKHLMCAAVEHSLNVLYDYKYFGPGLHNTVLALTNK